jgi:hypothetical protein
MASSVSVACIAASLVAVTSAAGVQAANTSRPAVSAAAARRRVELKIVDISVSILNEGVWRPAGQLPLP